MEKIVKPASGWSMLTLCLLMLFGGIALVMIKVILPGALLIVLAATIITPGFIAIEPNSTRVLTLFGE